MAGAAVVVTGQILACLYLLSELFTVDRSRPVIRPLGTRLRAVSVFTAACDLNCPNDIEAALMDHNTDEGVLQALGVTGPV
jgi:hypothetical protein